MFPIEVTCCLDTLQVTIRGKDLDSIKLIQNKIGMENLKYTRSDDAFLTVLPDTRKMFNLSMEDGISCLTFRRTCDVTISSDVL